MKRTPIGSEGANALGGLLGVPEGSTWPSASAPFDDFGAGPAITETPSVEAGVGTHAASVDLPAAALESDTLFASPALAASTDADIVSSWASPPTQPAQTPITEFDVRAAAAQTQEQNADQIDTIASGHGVSGVAAASFAPVAPASFAFTNAAPPLAPTLLANQATDSFGAFAAGANIGADAIPEHGESIGGGAHAAAAASASPVSAFLPTDLPSLANSPASLHGPVANGQTNGHIGSGGATAAQVQQALDESGLSVNGSGIKVGVLSDSFNNLLGAAADETSGALPSASHVQVLKDYASGGSDEGRAMMQIVHDIAPGADLAFYTAFDSEQDFANGILALAAAGCKVICDDVSYFDEPFFQNGVIAQAIQTVEAEGVTYVTAAGNEGSNAYQAAWTPIAHTSYDGYSLSDTESFGGSPVQTISVGGNVPLVLEWNQPYFGATSNIEMLVFQNGHLVGAAQGGAQSGNPWVGLELSAGTYQIAIENLSGPDPGLIKEITFGDGIPVTLSGANIGTVYGHAMTPGAITAGAVSAADTPAFGFNSPTSESFSSSGAGSELLFANNGTALWSPDVLNPVAVSGIDDIKTTVPGGLSDFYGTSAASASLAGVAALMLSANPNLTPAQVEQIMEATALSMSNSAVSGAGLVQVDAAVAGAMLGPVVTAANLTLSQASVAASSLFTVSDPGGHTVTEYAFEDTGSGHFVLNGVAQSNNQEIDVTADLPECAGNNGHAGGSRRGPDRLGRLDELCRNRSRACDPDGRIDQPGRGGQSIFPLRGRRDERS
jgi:Subtilase family